MNCRGYTFIMLPFDFKRNLTIRQLKIPQSFSKYLKFNVHRNWEYLDPVGGLQGCTAAEEYRYLLAYQVHSTVQTLIPQDIPK